MTRFRGAPLLRSVLFLIVLLLAAGPVGAQSGLTTVRVGAGLAASAGPPLFVALHKGWFEEEGLKVELQNMERFLDQPPALVAGHIDILLGVASGVTMSMMEKGADIAVVAGVSQSTKEPRRDTRGYVVRKDLWDSGEIRTLEDLYGRRVANFGTVDTRNGRAAGGVHLDAIFGDNFGKVDWVQIPREADILVALERKLIDAAVMRSPWHLRAVEQGLAVELLYESDYIETQIITVQATRRYLASNADVVVRFLRALGKATEYLRGVAEGQNVDEFVEIIRAQSDIPPEAALDTVRFHHYTTDLMLPHFYQQSEYLVEIGLLNSSIDWNDFIDLSYLEQAR